MFRKIRNLVLRSNQEDRGPSPHTDKYLSLSLSYQLVKSLGLRCFSSSWLLLPLQASMLRYLKMWYLPLEQTCAGGVCRGLLSRLRLCRLRRWRKHSGTLEILLQDTSSLTRGNSDISARGG